MFVEYFLQLAAIADTTVFLLCHMQCRCPAKKLEVFLCKPALGFLSCQGRFSRMPALKGSYDESVSTVMEALCSIRGCEPTLSFDRVYPPIVAASVYFCFTLT